MDPEIIKKILSSSSSSSSTSDDEDFLFLLGTGSEFFELLNIPFKKEKPEETNYIEDVVVNFTDDEFREHFRVSRKTAKAITQKFAASRYFKKRSNRSKKKPMSAQLHCLSFLWFAGNKKSYREVSSLFNMSTSTAYKCQTAFLEFLSDISSQYIKMPLTIVEKIEKCRGFAKVAGMHNVLGCIDRCNIQVRTPTHKIPSISPSITLQGICDADLKFMNVFIGTTDTVHNSDILKTSYMVKEIANICANRFHILGDAAYPLRDYLLTPYQDNGNLTPQQKLFNKKHCQTIVKIDNCLHVLKQRFRQLRLLDCFTIMRLSKFVLGCCVLHNLCIDEGDLWVDIYDDLVQEDQIEENLIVATEEHTEEGTTETKEDNIIDTILIHKGQMKRNAISEMM